MKTPSPRPDEPKGPRVSLALRTKLIIAVSMPIAVMAAVTLALWLVAGSVKGQVRASKDDSARYARTAQDLKLHAVEVQQFLSDISATRGQDGLDTGLKEADENAQAFREGLAQFKEYFTRTGDTKGISEVEKMGTDFEAFYALGITMAKAYVEGGPSAGNKMMPQFDKATDQLVDPLEQFVKTQVARLDSSLDNVEATTQSLRNTVVAALIVVIVCSSVMLLLTLRSIVGPIHAVADNLTEGAWQIASAARQFAQTSTLLAEGSSEQAASIEETSASLEEIASMTRRNAESADTARNLSKQTKSAADTGYADMGDMTRAMDAIKSSSEDISKIIRTIDEIALQTNILALNAAVEAARAGEAGAGFAVVADEVRSLAQRCAQSARETAEKIEASVSRSEQGVRISGKVAESLEQIVSKAREVDSLVDEIGNASKEQSQGISQVNSAVTQMEKVTQTNASGAEQSAAAAEELGAQADSLHQAVLALRRLVDGDLAAHKVEEQERAEGRFDAPIVSNSRQKPAHKLQKPEVALHFAN